MQWRYRNKAIMRNGESLKNNADADIFQTAICAVDVTNQPLSQGKI